MNESERFMLTPESERRDVLKLFACKRPGSYPRFRAGW